MHNSSTPIFITGFSGRFPDCNNVPELYNKLKNKQDCVSISKRYPDKYLQLPSRAGHINNIDKFDAIFFKMNKMHVEGMDIQIRLLLEVVYEALIDANLSLESVKNTNMGVYVGNCFSDYHNGIIQNIHNVNGYENLGSAISMSANKISYFFDLYGPSIAIDTACSSSLHALSVACSDIQSGKIDRAIVAGVSLNLRPVVSKVFQKYNMLSPNGTCFSFDERADGYCRSESINAIIIQRDVSCGYAKIVGYGINSNGNTNEGITFPNIKQQTKLFKEVCDNFNIDISKVEYIEAHGTGTTAGDNIEIQALNNVYGSNHKCIHLGSIKSNMGHAEGASGINSIIKCLLSYETGELLPNIHYNSTSHSHIINGRFKIVSDITPFNKGMIVVNNFGFGGTNAHIILDNGGYNYTKTETLTENNIQYVYSRTKEVCEDLLKENNLLNFFTKNTNDIQKFTWRGAKHNNFSKICNILQKPKLVYIYSGQGSNYNNMAKELYNNNQIFQDTIHRLQQFIKEIEVTENNTNQINLIELFTNGQNWLNKKYSSIGITSVQIGLTNILKEHGLEPDYIIGHSMGEIGCAYADNCLSEKECISISYIRSKMVELIHSDTFFYNYHDDLIINNPDIIKYIQNSYKINNIYAYQVKKQNADLFENIFPNFINKLDNYGRMIFISSTVENIQPILLNYPNVVIACYNSPDGLTLSGPYENILKIEKDCVNKNIFTKLVETDDIAYHSILLKPYAKYLFDKFTKIITSPIKRSEKWLSTSNDNNEYSDAQYHTDNIIGSVFFYQKIQELNLEIPHVFIEISANDGLLGQIKRTRGMNNTILLPSLSKKSKQDIHNIQQLFVQLWANGIQTITNPFQIQKQQLSINERYKIQWDHTENWKIITYKDFESENGNSMNVEYDLQGKHSFLYDHQIQKQSLFPAMGHVYTIWQMIGLHKPIHLSQFNIYKAVNLDKNQPKIIFTIKQNNNLFQIYYDNELVSSANLNIELQETFKQFDFLQPLPNNDNKQLKINGDMFYGLLSRYGYEYKNNFRIINEINMNGSYIQNSNHWISLLDGMLQTSIQNINGLYLPTKIHEIYIQSPTLILQDICIGVQNKYIYIPDKSVVIYNLETTLAPSLLKDKENESIQHIIEFIPYHLQYIDEIQNKKISRSLGSMMNMELVSDNIINEINTNIFYPIHSKYLDICSQIIYENTKDNYKLLDVGNRDIQRLFQYVQQNICEYIYSDNNIKDDLINTQLTIPVSNKIKKINYNVIYDELPENINSIDVIFCSNILRNSCISVTDNLIKLYKLLNENGFLLLEEPNSEFHDWLKDYFNPSHFTTVASYCNETTGLYLLRKTISKNYILIDKCTYGLHETFMNNQNYIITVPSDGFIKSIHKEPDYENSNVICAYLLNDTQYNYEYDDKIELEKQQLNKVIEYAQKHQLKINIINDGVIGSYRMIHKPKLNLELQLDNNINFEIKIEKPGMLQSLQYIQQPTADIDILYTGLNFKDVMLSYGKLKVNPKNIHLGLEFSGMKGTQPVMGMGKGTCSKQIQSNSVIYWNIPKTWNLAEASTIPCVYSTVYYALDYKCRITKGQSILIHAGAGGIGQSAIHLCLLRGLKVYTTCSKNKRDFLKNRFHLKDSDIGNSRDTSFYEWIMKETNGVGVDIVLNSLSEEKLLLSIDCVKSFGQFCEIGKFDVMNNNSIGMKALENNISIHVIDLSTMFEHEFYKVVLYGLIQNGIDKNEITPLNIDKQFHHTKLDDAIRYMGGGNHMGKIVIDMSNIPDDNKIKIKPRFHTSETHIITGGMGGFGMELASWLIECGANKIHLVGRNGITNLYQKRQFEKYGEKMKYICADITCENDVSTLFNNNSEKIQGVWHLAMILKDKLYKDINSQDWDNVVDVKNKAAFLLAKYCPKNALFVTWSSVSSLFGNAGQTNYAYGNFKMEQICRARKEQGLHALSINWGAIENIGYLSKESSKINQHISSFVPQNIDDCLEDLHYLLYSSSPVITCYKKPIIIEDKNKTQMSLLEKILSVLGIQKTTIDNLDKNITLSELGMDSLQVVSIKNLLKTEGKTMTNIEIQQMKLNAF